MPSGSWPVEVFISYSHRDDEFRAQLETHLALLKRSGAVKTWHDRRIGAGQEWSNEISEHLESADLILLLISADFLASDYCYDIEMKQALKRHEAGLAAVIPIIVRKVDNWESAPFSKLQVLPKDGKAITTWPDRDEAWSDVARGIRLAVDRLREMEEVPDSRIPPPPRMPATQDRLLDAGMPARVAVGRGTQLVAMIRRVDSEGLRAVLQLDDTYSVSPEQVKSKAFRMEFPRDPLGALQPAEMLLRVESPDFEPKSQEKKLPVPPDADSEACVFLLKPLSAGDLIVNLEVRYQDVHRGSRPLRTHAELTEVPLPPGPQVLVSIPLMMLSQPGEFTRYFQAPHAPTTDLPAAAAPATPGEFTRMIEKALPPPRRRLPGQTSS